MKAGPAAVVAVSRAGIFSPEVASVAAVAVVAEKAAAGMAAGASSIDDGLAPPMFVIAESAPALN